MATNIHWERLEIEPADLAKHPKITPILIKSLGKIDAAVEYLRGSDAKEALEFLRLWDAGTKAERKAVPFEGYCLAAKTTPKRMMGIIMEAVTEQSHTASELLVAAAHPAIVERTIKNAKTKAGLEDRKIIHQKQGFMPTPKTQIFNNSGVINQDNRKQLANVSVSQLEADNDRIASAVEDFNADRSKQLGTGPVEIIDVTAEEV